MNKKLFLSTTLCILLLTVRMCHSSSLSYIFLLWNLFLAFIPYLISTSILSRKITGITLLSLSALWLLFLPNALYIITDLKHLRERPFVPVWYDCLLLFSFSALALLLGLLSFYQMNQILKKYVSATIQPVLLTLTSIATGFGVYLGRVERWNSWDVFTQPLFMISEITRLVTLPYVWIFSISYGLSFLIMYYIILSLVHLRYETSRQLV